MSVIYWSILQLAINRTVDLQNQNYGFIGNYLISPWVLRSWIILISSPTGIPIGPLVILAEYEQKALCGKHTRTSSASDQWVAFFYNRSTLECPDSNQETKPSTPASQQRKCAVFHTRQAPAHFPVPVDDNWELQLIRLVLNSFCVNWNHFWEMQRSSFFPFLSTLGIADLSDKQRPSVTTDEGTAHRDLHLSASCHWYRSRMIGDEESFRNEVVSGQPNQKFLPNISGLSIRAWVYWENSILLPDLDGTSSGDRKRTDRQCAGPFPAGWMPSCERGHKVFRESITVKCNPWVKGGSPN